MTTQQFWKPSTSTGAADDLLDENDIGGGGANIHINYPLQRQILPIAAHRTQILYALENYGVLILVGETGCGKSTQLPQYFYENGWADPPVEGRGGNGTSDNNGNGGGGGGGGGYREIICTQPRRLAAITLANRLTHEMADPSLVGYSVRFSSTYNPGVTKIRYVTDGWLLRETTLLDPLLKHCSMLIIDEAHERSLNTELLLGVVKKIRRVRPELRVVICSATLDAQAFLEFFVGKSRKRKDKKNVDEKQVKKRKSRWGKVADATTNNESSQTISRDLTDGTIISVDGRQHPVDIMYKQESVSDYVKSTVEIALQIHDSEIGDGDILCFLPTGEEIDEAVELAEHIISSSYTTQNKKGQRLSNAVCLPLYSTLPAKLQSQPFLPRSNEEVRSNTRRIIFATNIAETSVTVPNIAHVIDCGFAKMPFFDPYSGFDRLIICPISRASAQQRAGRAGRVRPGKCYRLYSEKDYRDVMENETAPEIQRCNLTTLLMTIKALGVKNVLSFDLMSVPSVEALSHGLECLYVLGAMDDDAELTTLGREMVYFPTDPRVSRMLLAALDMEAREETPSMISRLIVGDILTVAAALQVRNLFYQPRTERQWRMYDDAMADILDRSGDHVTMVHLFDLVDHSNKMLSEEECRERFVNRVALQRALDVRNQLARFLSRRFGSGSHWFGSKRQEIVGSQTFDSDERSEAIRKCVCAGYFMNVAKLGSGGRYYTLRGNFAVSVSSSSVLHRYGESSEYILFGQTFDGSRGGVDAKPCSSMSGLWLRQLASHYWT